MLLSYYVINLVGEEGDLGRQKTVLAAVPCPLDHLAA